MVISAQQSHALVVPLEALSVAQLVARFAGGAVLALVLDAARRVGEADLIVEEVFGATFGTHPIGVGIALAVLLLALEETVQEVPGTAQQTFLRRLLAPLEAGTGLDALALRRKDSAARTQLALALS